MTRSQVQLALFASSAWLLTWVSAIVLAVVVRGPEEPAWIVNTWILAMSAAGVLIALSLLWLVIADTARGGRRPARAEEPETELASELEAEPEDLLDVEGLPEPEDQAGAAGRAATSGLASEVGVGSVRPLGPPGTGPSGPSGPSGPNQISIPVQRDFPSSSVPGESALLRGRQGR